MRALVTGAAGFLGSHLVDRLLADGHQVTGLDDLSTGHLAHLAAARGRGGFALHTFDVGAELVHDLVRREQPDVVLHLAPVLPVRLLAAAHEVGARFVLASDAAVYGSTARPVTERHACHPATLAGAHHAAAEAFVQAHVAQGLAATTLRLSSVYGPRSRGVVATWVRALSAGRPAYLLGNGSQVRDWVHVEDVVDAFVRVLGGRVDGRRLNIGSGRGVRLRDLHTQVARAVASPDAPEYLPARPEDLASVLVDPGAARRALGWQATVALPEGLARTVDALS